MSSEPDPSQREKEIFYLVADIDDGDLRARRLAELCGDDQVLQERVELLLKLDEGGTAFMDQAVLTTAATPPSDRIELVTNLQSIKSDSSGPDYEVGSEIARGGMGQVRRAEDLKLERTVAVKVMHEQAAQDKTSVARFLFEAKVLARLEHPNIVPVHDIVWEGDRPLFYSMKLVKGKTLQAIINELREEQPEALSSYPLSELLSIFQKVCDAIAFAHSRGIIHRDLKPENIMVGEFGEVLVMDWGLAKRLRTEKGSDCFSESEIKTKVEAEIDLAATQMDFEGTIPGSVMGTPQYMSPEQARGEIDQIDEQSDIFSLGGILYAILTLRPPVEGSTLQEVLEKVKSAAITAPKTFGTAEKGEKISNGEVLEAKKFIPLPHLPVGRVPSALSAVAMKALTLDKAKRYRSIAKFSADVRAYQGGFATSAENAGLMKQLKLLIKRNKAVFFTASTAWLLLTILATWFILNLRVKEQRAVAGEREALREKEAARLSSATANIALADAALRENNGPAMRDALANVPEDLRNLTYAYLLDRSDNSIARIKSDDRQIDSVAAHPKSPGVFALADSSHKIILMKVRTGVRSLEFKPGFHHSSSGPLRLAFSPDGQRIAVGQQNGNRIVMHSAKDGSKLLEWEATETFRLEFSPDGKYLLQTDTARGAVLSMWDAATGNLCWKYENRVGETVGKFTPDGLHVITHSLGDGVRLVNAQDGSIVRVLSNRRASFIAVHPDGTKAVIGGRYTDVGKIQCVFLHNAAVAFEIRPHDREYQHLSFTPEDTRFVAVSVLADGRQEIQVRDANTGVLLQTLLGGSGYVTEAAVHRLSGELVVGGQNSRVWNLINTPPKWTLKGRSPESGITFWGEEDNVFATAQNDYAVLQKLDKGSPQVLWKPPTSFYRLASVSADGRFAAISNGSRVSIITKPGDQVKQVDNFGTNHRMAFHRISPKGDRLAITSVDFTEVELYNTSSGQRLKGPERSEIIKFSDLGWLNEEQLLGLVTAKARRGIPASEEWVVLWDADTGKILKTVSHSSAMDVLVVAPDGRCFAEAGADKMVRIRDAASLEVQLEFRAHDSLITALAWHPLKPIVASTSTDLTVKIWNTETGSTLEEFRGMLTAPDSLSFSSSGKWLGCAGNGNFPRIWEPASLSRKPAPDRSVPPGAEP